MALFILKRSHALSKIEVENPSLARTSDFTPFFPGLFIGRNFGLYPSSWITRKISFS